MQLQHSHASEKPEITWQKALSLQAETTPSYRVQKVLREQYRILTRLFTYEKGRGSFMISA